MAVKEMYDLTGKTAVVIGGARNLGYDMAEALAEAGCDVALTSRTRENAEAAAERLNSAYGCDVLAADLDVREHTQVEAFAERAQQWKKPIDILVNNAGGVPKSGPTNLFERDPEHAKEVIDTNLTGTLFSCQVFGRIMAHQGSGSVINIASIAGMVGRDRRMYNSTGLPEQPIDYAAAKAGVIGMTRDLAGLLTPKGVRVNAISPGGFERGQPQAFIDAYSDATAMARMGRDGVDLKGAVLFLASSASEYVTGHNLVVDGGFAMWK